jgi:8-oxo-dGTP pyrophosphatase MutT (NUDIX family)
VLDPDGAVLLFRYDDAPPNERHWTTPGGGLDDGEDFLDAARRELAEETGWTDVLVAPRVLTERTFPMEYAGRMVLQREQLFLARVSTPRRTVADVDGMHASDGISGWRWWTLAELDATQESVWPQNLSEVIRSISSL